MALVRSVIVLSLLLFFHLLYLRTAVFLFSCVKQHLSLPSTLRNTCYAHVKDEAGEKRALQRTSQWVCCFEIWLNWPKIAMKDPNLYHFLKCWALPLRPEVHTKLYRKIVNCIVTSTLFPFSLTWNTFTLLISW